MIQFIHIPKTGGTSIEFAYKDYGWGRLHYYSKKYAIYPWHDDILLKEIFENDICFCIIRNPIDRLLSEYRFRNNPDDPISMNNIIHKWSIDLVNYSDILNNHLRPQYYYANFCQHLLLFDMLEDELKKLLPLYNINIKPLEHFNNTNNKYHNINASLINDDNMKWINEYYKCDFILYNSLLYDKSFI